MQKNKLPSLITILILTLITVLMWVGFTIYRAFTTTPEPSVPKEVSAPLTPTLDTGVITKIESSLFFNESQIPQLSFSPSPSPVAPLVPTTAPLITPTGSPSATLSTPAPSPTP